MSKWAERRVLAYAHQGGAREGPSSTLYAIEKALRAGADAIELDVHQSLDGHLVVGHDATVDRTTDGSGPIAALRLLELQALDNACYFVPGVGTDHDRRPEEYPLRGRAPADRSLGIATLDEVLVSFPGVLLNLDIKSTAPAVPAYEAKLARVLRAHRRSCDVVVASFDDRSIEAFSSAAPEIGTAPGSGELLLLAQAVLCGEPPSERLKRHVAVQVPQSFRGVRVVDERFVEVVHGLGLALHVWTIDEEDEMASLAALGVDGIMTDRPSALVGVLERLGLRYRRSDPIAGST